MVHDDYYRAGASDQKLKGAGMHVISVASGLRFGQCGTVVLDPSAKLTSP